MGRVSCEQPDEGGWGHRGQLPAQHGLGSHGCVGGTREHGGGLHEAMACAWGASGGLCTARWGMRGEG